MELEKEERALSIHMKSIRERKQEAIEKHQSYKNK